MRRFRARLVAYLEDRHDRKVVIANARQQARDLIPPHGDDYVDGLRRVAASKRERAAKPISSGGGAARLTPAPHPTPRPDEPKEIQ